MVEDARIEKINRIITESGDRSSRMQEAMILSDSRNLEDMGAVGIFNELRESITGGKGVSEVVSSWQSKIDYRYWQARLEKSFRFTSVRELAGQRLLHHVLIQTHHGNSDQDPCDELLIKIVARFIFPVKDLEIFVRCDFINGLIKAKSHGTGN